MAIATFPVTPRSQGVDIPGTLIGGGHTTGFSRLDAACHNIIMKFFSIISRRG